MFAYAPVMSGDWKQKEVWDGSYTFRDLLDWHEMNRVKQINQRRYEEFQKVMEGSNAGN